MNRSWMCVALLLLPACSDVFGPVRQFEVQGVVRSTLLGNPVAGAHLTAFIDGGLNGLTILGTATADASGRFMLRSSVRSSLCDQLRLKVEAADYEAAPGIVAAFGQAIGCESPSLSLLMYPAIVSATIEPAAPTTDAGRESILQARGVFADGYTGLVPSNHDFQGTLWHILGAGQALCAGS